MKIIYDKHPYGLNTNRKWVNYSFIRIILSVILAAAVVCCNHRHAPSDTGTVWTDSLLSAYRIQIQVDPTNTMKEIRQLQESITDSIIYQHLNGILAIGYFMDNKIDSAIIYDKNVLRFCESQNLSNPDIAMVAIKSYNDLGVFFQLTGQIDSAIFYQEKAAIMADRSGEKQLLTNIYVNIADNYNHKSDLPSTAHYYRKALLIADSLELGIKASHIHSGLAHVYTDLKNFEEADYYFKKVEAVLDSLSDYDIYYFCNTRGNYYYSKREYENALPWFWKANAVASRFNQGSFVATTETNLGELYLMLAQLDSAKYYLDRAAVHFLSDEASPSSKYYVEGLYASYYLEKGDLGKAQYYLSRADDSFQPNPIYVYYNHKRHEELYKRQGNYRKAYEMSKVAAEYDDSIRNITIQNTIAEIDSRYRQDTIVLKRDIQLAHQEQQLMVTQRTNIFIISLFIISILIAIIVSIVQKRKREQLQKHQLSVIARLRMETIRNRVPPHFMFNVLNSVVPGLSDHKEFSKPMQLLVESIRGSLVLSEKLTISLEEEINLVKNYLELVRTMNPEMPEIRWEISPEVDMKTPIPSMILQIPVENAVKYAFDGHKEEDLIAISIFQKENVLHIDVQDNGIGFNTGRASDPAKGAGIGLKVLYKTIEMLNVMNNKKMEFEMKNEVDISADRNGTGVFIKIPSDYKYEL